MGKILRSFTFDRNTLKSNSTQSAIEAERHIRLASSGADLSKTQSNIIGALRSYMGVIDRDKQITPAGEKFLKLFGQNPEDAWRWLLTRSLWLFSVPNGTRADVNLAASAAGNDFSFFRLILGVLTHLSALPGEERFLYYDELCAILDDDDAWSMSPYQFFEAVRERRSSPFSPIARSLLGDLEDQYQISRDNLNTVLNKAFLQTGLFQFAQANGVTIGIALRDDLDPVLRGRLRYVLDHPGQWDGTDWEAFLGLGHVDFPDDVSHRESAAIPLTPTAAMPLEGLIDALAGDLVRTGLQFDRTLLARFVASLLAKRFVILTGLSGSGKTRIAQAFAQWISAKWAQSLRFTAGETIQSDRIEYRVTAADNLSVEFESSDSGTKVALPYDLIQEWITAIEEAGFDRSTPARTIRDRVSPTSKYSTQLSSFETHLKAAAFAAKERSNASGLKHYEIVAVGPDWTSRDSCFGYVDALHDDRFVRTTPIVDLILRAQATPSAPFFLILDEMNLSHVERYFAEFLSAAESDELMHIHGAPSFVDGVPPALSWPPNLFVIGTVNVDETTYMFSPKVLDRANTIEFRVRESEIVRYLSAGTPLALTALEAQGVQFADCFLGSSAAKEGPAKDWPRLSAEVQLLFNVLQDCGLEFGFRTAMEMRLFFGAYQLLEPSASDVLTLLDAQMLQKVLPKLSGSRRRLEGPLCSLAVLSRHPREWDEQTASLSNAEAIRSACLVAGSLIDPTLHPLSDAFGSNEKPALPLAFDKLVRMLRRLDSEGFTSFAES